MGLETRLVRVFYFLFTLMISTMFLLTRATTMSTYDWDKGDEGWDRETKEGLESQTRLEPQVRVFFYFYFFNYYTNDILQCFYLPGQQQWRQ